MLGRSVSFVSFVSLVLAGSLGCGFPKAGAVPPPVEGEAAAAAATKWKGATPEVLAEGRALFVGKCNACHDHPDVDAIADDKWPAIVGEMREKAKLDARQGESVLRFVLAAKKR